MRHASSKVGREWECIGIWKTEAITNPCPKTIQLSNPPKPPTVLSCQVSTINTCLRQLFSPFSQMADIAMLVAEEYERRSSVPRNRVGSDSGKQFQIDLVSWVANMGQKLKTKLELANLGFEPKTQIGAEAFTGALSA
ncbi:hypothetical protein V6N13_043579 [Hibiscus sabdariffa]|uniref:Uncharacterized protein n=1 Tax=Hibiscus sabdariffa TaxID=183260 RepID=A0ABR2RFK6_9ROSI